MTATYDVREAIRSAVDDDGLSDPREISARVVEAMPDEDLRPTLIRVLPEYARIMLHGYERWGQPSGREPQASVGSAPAKSAKVAAYQQDANEWQVMLNKRVHAEDEWKPFGECSRSDVQYLAADRRENAAESIAAAERFEKYDAAMAEYGVECVADLPAEVIATIEDGA